MKEYAIYGRVIGTKDKPKKLGKVKASSHKEALKIARGNLLVYTVTKVRLIGKINPEWIPEEALQAAIFGKRYLHKRVIRKKKKKINE